VHGQEFEVKEEEFFSTGNNNLVGYSFILNRKNLKTGQIFKRNFFYKLSPATERDMEKYQFIYPE
jgi:hypothetical protein